MAAQRVPRPVGGPPKQQRPGPHWPGLVGAQKGTRGLRGTPVRHRLKSKRSRPFDSKPETVAAAMGSSAPSAPGALQAGPGAGPGNDAQKGLGWNTEKGDRPRTKKETRARKFWRPEPNFWALVSGPESGPDFGAIVLCGHRNGVHPAVPESGPCRRPLSPFLCAAEAVGAWRWANFWASLCPSGKRVVFVNVDETSVPMQYPANTGYVHIPRGSSRRQAIACEQASSLAQRRAYMSLVAMLSDDPGAQRLLPQVLVSNERQLPKAAHAELTGVVANCETQFVWRRRSAWVDATAMVRILHLLRESLRPIWQEVHVVLLLDCCPVHASRKVVAAAGRLGFRLVMVPASMTGILQPLDAYAFAGLKKRHRDCVLDESMRNQSGALSVVTHCAKLLATVHSFISSGSWARAFRGCGFGDEQKGLGGRARAKLQWPVGPPEVGRELPSLGDLQAVWLRGKELPIDHLFRLALRPMAEEETVGPDDPPSGAHPWAGRLRSHSALGLGAAGSAVLADTGAAPRVVEAPWARRRIPRAKPLWGWRSRGMK